jgi:hypothetical protein
MQIAKLRSLLRKHGHLPSPPGQEAPAGDET